MSRIFISLLLTLACAGACTTVSARTAQKHSADSSGGSCPELAREAKPVRASAHSADSATPEAPATPTHGAAVQPVTQRSSGDAGDASLHNSRWHSFLPGMFR